MCIIPAWPDEVGCLVRGGMICCKLFEAADKVGDAGWLLVEFLEMAEDEGFQV